MRHQQRRTWGFVLLLVFVCSSLGWPLSPTAAQAAEPSVTAAGDERVWIPDSYLRASMNKAIGHHEDADIYQPTRSELSQIKGVFYIASEFPINAYVEYTSLEGIQYLTGISELIVSGGHRTNIGELEMELIGQLTQLEYLSLQNSRIRDISFVTSLKNLRGMVLQNNHIQDITYAKDYYNSPKRKQFNFLYQTVELPAQIHDGPTFSFQPSEAPIYDLDGSVVSYLTNKDGTYDGTNIVWNTPKAGNYKFEYTVRSTIINHAGKYEGKVIVPVTVLATVTAHYVDEAGQVLAEPEVRRGNVGEDYRTAALELDGYQLSEVIGEPEGLFEAEPKTVTYVYEKAVVPPLPAETGRVVLKKADKSTQSLLPDAVFRLLDQNGTVIADEVTTNEQGQMEVSELPTGRYQFIETKAPEGYKLDPTPLEFVIEAGKTTEIIKHNEKLETKSSSVLVSYVDESGTEIAESVMLEGEIGEPYRADRQEIDGYQLVEIKGEAEGYFQESPNTVVFVYKKLDSTPVPPVGHEGRVVLMKTDDTKQLLLADAVFRLLDRDGNLIASELVTNQEGQLEIENLAPGSYYFIEVKAPDGYERDETPIPFVIEERQTTFVTAVNQKEELVTPPTEGTDPGEETTPPTEGTDPGEETTPPTGGTDPETNPPPGETDPGEEIVPPPGDQGEEGMLEEPGLGGTDEEEPAWSDPSGHDESAKVDEEEAEAGVRPHDDKENAVPLGSFESGTATLPTQKLPQTGERSRHGQTLLGLFLIVCAIYVFAQKKKLEP